MSLPLPSKMTCWARMTLASVGCKHVTQKTILNLRCLLLDLPLNTVEYFHSFFLLNHLSFCLNQVVLASIEATNRPSFWMWGLNEQERPETTRDALYPRRPKWHWKISASQKDPQNYHRTCLPFHVQQKSRFITPFYWYFSVCQFILDV